MRTTGSCPSITVHTLTPSLSWTPPTGAAGYTVEIFTGSCGGTLIHTSPTQTDASYMVPDGVLDMGTTYYWRVTATPSTGYCTGEASACCAMTTACPTITLSFPNGSVATAYSSNAVTATGGIAPYICTKTSGALPPGLTLHTNGTLDGTPTTCGDFTFTVTAADALGCTGSQSCTMHIAQISSNPCTDCASDTPTVTVSGVPSPTDLGLPWMADGNGAYSFNSFNLGIGCTWLCYGPANSYGGWSVVIGFAGTGNGAALSDPHGGEYGVGSQTNNFVCDCGKLRGSATLTGTANSHAYTITISIV